MNDPDAAFSAFDREVVERVWLLAQAIVGNDPAVWRKDEHGAWMHRQDYRNRRSQFGWEIADHGFFLRRSGVASLRAIQWENFVDFMVVARMNAVVTADGLNNIRKLI